MTDQQNRGPAPLAAAGTPASDATIENGGDARRDAHGFDPTEFEWRPVPRKPRADGWTPDVQRAFIEALARTGLVERACLEVDRSVKSAYALRNAPGGEGFCRAWDTARHAAAGRLLDVCFTRAVEGEEVPVYDQDGVRTGVQYRYNTRLTMFLLRAYYPDLFGRVGVGVDARGEAAGRAKGAPALPMPEVIAALGPVIPADPHLLAAPDVLARRIAEARRATADPVDRIEGFAPTIAPPTHPRVADRAERRRARRRLRDEG